MPKAADHSRNSPTIWKRTTFRGQVRNIMFQQWKSRQVTDCEKSIMPIYSWGSVPRFIGRALSIMSFLWVAYLLAVILCPHGQYQIQLVSRSQIKPDKSVRPLELQRGEIEAHKEAEDSWEILFVSTCMGQAWNVQAAEHLPVLWGHHSRKDLLQKLLTQV